jgi:hypothetical protein
VNSECGHTPCPAGLVGQKGDCCEGHSNQRCQIAAADAHAKTGRIAAGVKPPLAQCAKSADDAKNEDSGDGKGGDQQNNRDGACHAIDQPTRTDSFAGDILCPSVALPSVLDNKTASAPIKGDAPIYSIPFIQIRAPTFYHFLGPTPVGKVTSAFVTVSAPHLPRLAYAATSLAALVSTPGLCKKPKSRNQSMKRYCQVP